MARPSERRIEARHGFDVRTGRLVVDLVVEGVPGAVRLSAELARQHALEVGRLADEALAARPVAVVEVDATCDP